jgi:hypothetical protein
MLKVGTDNAALNCANFGGNLGRVGLGCTPSERLLPKFSTITNMIEKIRLNPTLNKIQELEKFGLGIMGIIPRTSI